MKKYKSIIVLVLCLIFPGFVLSSHGAESITISCYAGNPDDRQHVGDIEVFNVSNAASLCNITLYDCKGKCTGCYIDEASNEVCIDSTGRRYTR